MNKSILFFDATTKLVNPQDEFFIGVNTRELIINEDTLIDEVLTTIINDNLLEEEYTNIILPACFGAILSNFIGLRLATQIRCTPGVNQTSNIFLYSFTGIQDYFNNECFNILKTTGVSLIDYDIQKILNCFNKQQRFLKSNNLKQQVSNLKLDVPLNYADSHSVANEWAIYRWANALNTSDDQILKIETKLENDLYFKYLKAINPVNELEEINLKELKLTFTGDPKVLYIDDEAEKGWWEIFCKILDDENEISFSHLDDEFNQKNQNEIIDISFKKVIEEKIDIVLLDLRLHKEDFNNKPIDEITGFKILEKIKNHNKGIQVIIFSATNKIWNLQALQNAGADGFIIKESPNNNYEPGFTKKSIEKMMQSINDCLENIFLKDFYTQYEKLSAELIPRKNFKKSTQPLPKEFVDEVLKWFKLSLNILQNRLSIENLTSVFLIYFSIIENMSNRIIETENPIREGDFYKFQFRKNFQKLNNFVRESEDFYRKTNSEYKSKTRGLSWAIKIYNTIDFISEDNLGIESINELVVKRNKIIHLNSTFGDFIEVEKRDIILLNKIIFRGLIKII